jgi:hypothetical protein
MFKQVIVLFSIVLLLLSSCDTSSQSHKNTAVDVESQYRRVSADEICSIEIPNYFVKMSDLNSDALLQYGYNDTVVDSTALLVQDAIYVTTSVYYKMDLQKQLVDTLEFSLMEFNDQFVENIKLALDDARAEYEKPNINIHNGMKSLHNEIYGSYGDDLVYYQIGLFETEIAYYQVLSWCLQDHLAKHKDEMFKMTTSFKEI